MRSDLPIVPLTYAITKLISHMYKHMYGKRAIEGAWKMLCNRRLYKFISSCQFTVIFM